MGSTGPVLVQVWPPFPFRSLLCLCSLYLHSIVGVLIVEDEGFLNLLVISFQLIDLWLVVYDALLVLPQVIELVL